MYILSGYILLSWKSCQSSFDKYLITTTVDSLSFSDSGGSKSFTITANAPMAVYLNSGTDWVSYSPKDTVASASGYQVTVTVPSFAEPNSRRTTQLTIRCGDLATDAVMRSANAKEHTASTRLYGLVDAHLLWAWDIAALGHELVSHASGRLARAD